MSKRLRFGVNLRHHVSYVFGVCRDVVGRLAIVGALRQPPLDRVTVGGGVILAATLETEIKT